EYKKAYWNEKTDEYLFERHKKEIFPLLKMRSVFSGIENFRMYDFVTDQGTDENVFAITNKDKKNIGFYIYNNAYRETQGYVRNSVLFKDKSGGNETSDDIFSVFGLKNAPDCYLIYRDRTRELDYIVSAKDIYEKGLWFNLKAYEYLLFTDFRAVKDDEWGHYGKLWSSLNGEGVSDIKEAYENVALGPLHSRLKKILDKNNFDMLWELYKSKEKDDVKIYYFFQKVADSLKTAKDYAGGYENKKDITDKIYKDFIFILKTDWSRHINKNVISEKGAVYYLCIWMLLRHFGEMKYGIDDPVLSASLINEWKLKDYILNILPKDEFVCTAEGVLECLVQVIRTQNWTDPLFSGDKTVAETLRDYLLLDSTLKVIKANRFNNTMWFNKECIMSLTELMRISFFVHTETVRDSKKRVYVRKVAERLAGSMTRMCEKSEYKFDNLLRMLSE
ncbi:MAG: hypothetical protein KBT47_09680, partial [Armatimonadetes bacterium]|nr:hypothetical protein [Candidatus Hippobium faecium]